MEKVVKAVLQSSDFTSVLSSILWGGRVCTPLCLLHFNSYTISSPPLAPFPDGLVSLPQIERIQFFQEIVKGQEESRVHWGPSGTPP